MVDKPYRQADMLDSEDPLGEPGRIWGPNYTWEVLLFNPARMVPLVASNPVCPEDYRDTTGRRFTPTVCFYPR